MTRREGRGGRGRRSVDRRSIDRSITKTKTKTRRFGILVYRARDAIGLGTRGYRAKRRGRTLSGTGEASSASACTGWSPLLSSLTSSIPAASFLFPRPVAGGSFKAGASAFFSARPAFAAPEAGRGAASAFAPSSGLFAGESFLSPAGFSVATAPDFGTDPARTSARPSLSASPHETLSSRVFTRGKRDAAPRTSAEPCSRDATGDVRGGRTVHSIH